jgi:hypothetical protein
MSALKYVADFVIRALGASAVMTVSQHTEMGLTHRPGSELPVRVIESVTCRSIPRRGIPGILAGQLVQGTLAAAALAQARLTRHCSAAPALVFGVLFLVSINAVVVWALGLSDMPWRWSKRELGVDILHKTTLAVATHTITRRRA